MPFPLAHPAAILPLRRFCPRWLNPAALVVGTIVPDTSYFFSRWGWDTVAHAKYGAILYALPAGVVALAVFRLALRVAARRFPAGQAWTQMLGPTTPMLLTLLSLVIGAATHVAWDSVTHKTGWLIEAWPVLREPLFPLLGRTVKAQHLLWYVSSFGGVAAVYWAFDRSARRALNRTPTSGRRLALNSLIAACLVLPIAGIHHLVPDPWGNILTAGLTLLLTLWAIREVQRKARSVEQEARSTVDARAPNPSDICG